MNNPIDDMYKDGNIKVKPPQPLNKKKQFNDVEFERFLKEHSLLNKQYNKLLVETNTLRKRFAYQEQNMKNLSNELGSVKNENNRMKQRLDALLVTIESIYAKLGKK